MAQEQPRNRCSTLSWTSAMTLLSSLLFVCSAVFYAYTVARPPPTSSCVDRLFPDALAKSAIEYHRENLIDFFVPRSILRGPPEAQRESKWNELTPYGVIELDNPPAPKDTSGLIKGNGKHLAVLGFTLHLNCLRIIRQYVYVDMNQTLYRPPTRARADSCIELLRRELLCKFDTTPYLMANTESTRRGVIPSVATAHVCRNHERLAGWAQQNFVQDHRAPEGWVELDL